MLSEVPLALLSQRTSPLFQEQVFINAMLYKHHQLDGDDLLLIIKSKNTIKPIVRRIDLSFNIKMRLYDTSLLLHL